MMSEDTWGESPFQGDCMLKDESLTSQLRESKGVGRKRSMWRGKKPRDGNTISFRICVKDHSREMSSSRFRLRDIAQPVHEWQSRADVSISVCISDRKSRRTAYVPFSVLLYYHACERNVVRIRKISLDWYYPKVSHRAESLGVHGGVLFPFQ